MSGEEHRAGAGASVTVAINLMRMALALLDKAGEDIAAIRLQHASTRRLKSNPHQEKNSTADQDDEGSSDHQTWPNRAVGAPAAWRDSEFTEGSES